MAQEVKTFFPKSEALSSSPLVVHICRQPICNTILLKSGHAQQKFVAWFSQSLILLYDFKSVAERELPFFARAKTAYNISGSQSQSRSRSRSRSQSGSRSWSLKWSWSHIVRKEMKCSGETEIVHKLLHDTSRKSESHEVIHVVSRTKK